MAAIGTRKFVFWDDQHLVLANETYCRKLYLPSGWVRIRFGMLCALNPNGTLNVFGSLLFGIGSGATAPVSALNTDNFVGICPNGVPSPNPSRQWNYTANTSWPYFAISTTGNFFKKQGQTYTTSANISTCALAAAGLGNQKRRSVFILDITRQVGGSGAATIAFYNSSTAGMSQLDYRPDHLLDALDQIGTPVVYGQTLSSFSTSTLNISDVAGTLDTLCAYWSSALFPLEVYAIGANVITDGQYDGLPSGANDTFESYSIGTITDAGTINAGFNWPNSSAVFYGTTNAGSQFGFASTSVGSPYDPFDFYNVGTASVLSAGSGWAGPSIFYGTSNPASGTSGPYAFGGSDAGMPYDTFEGYALTNNLLVPLTGGTGWSSQAFIYGTANPSSGLGYAGTAFGFPYDTFDAYAVGTATSTVLSGGTCWGSYGTVFPGS